MGLTTAAEKMRLEGLATEMVVAVALRRLAGSASEAAEMVVVKEAKRAVD